LYIITGFQQKCKPFSKLFKNIYGIFFACNCASA